MKATLLFLTATALLALCEGNANYNFTISYFDRGDFTFTESQPYLPRDEARTHCYSGVWLTYTGSYFQWGNFEVANSERVDVHTEIDWTCEAVPDYFGRVWSAHRVGLVTDVRKPSVTFATVKPIQDEIIVMEDGIPKIDFAMKSMITINTGVEFFKGEDFTGDSYCFTLDPSYCYSNGVCAVLDWHSFDLPWYISLVKSARVGCTKSNKGVSYFTPKGFLPRDYPTSYSIYN